MHSRPIFMALRTVHAAFESLDNEMSGVQDLLGSGGESAVCKYSTFYLALCVFLWFLFLYLLYLELL